MRIVIFLSVILIPVLSSAQDFIIRITGDTLRANVDSQNESFIYYYDHEIKTNDIQVISRKEVAEVIYNADSNLYKRKKKTSTRNHEIVHLTLQYNGFYINNTEMVIHKGIDDYYEKLQFATGLCAKADVFFNANFGLGAMFSTSKSYNSINPVITPWGGMGKLVDDIRLNYYGINGVFKYQLGDSNADLLFSLGIGLQTFRNSGSIGYQYLLTGHNLGFQGSGQFNIFLGDGIYISVSLGYIGKNVQNLSSDFPIDAPENFKRDLTIVVRNTPTMNIGRIFIGAGLAYLF